MGLLVGVGDPGEGVVDAGGCAVKHRILHSELLFVGDLSGEVGTVLVDGAEGDLYLLQGQDDADVRADPEEFWLGGLDLRAGRGTLKGAEQLLEGLLMMKLASSFS
jgi:hypothetical protein